MRITIKNNKISIHEYTATAVPRRTRFFEMKNEKFDQKNPQLEIFEARKTVERENEIKSRV